VLGVDVDGINEGYCDGVNEFNSAEGALVVGFVEGGPVGFQDIIQKKDDVNIAQSM
jgi:hypothetical protein